MWDEAAPSQPITQAALNKAREKQKGKMTPTFGLTSS
jgi:hypothetical protein